MTQKLEGDTDRIQNCTLLKTFSLTSVSAQVSTLLTGEAGEQDQNDCRLLREGASQKTTGQHSALQKTTSNLDFYV